MKIKYEDLELAYEFSSMSFPDDHSAYICKNTGKIYYDSDASEDELPEDIYLDDNYLKLPGKLDLDLGKFLVFRFVEAFLPLHLNEVYKIFRRKGAYSRYNAFLRRLNCTDKWYEYEESEKRSELLGWCKINELDVEI